MSNEDKLKKKSAYSLLVQLSQKIEADIEENGTNYDALYMVMLSWEEEAKRQKEIVNRLRISAKKQQREFRKTKKTQSESK
ncbi:hypothetical protein [Enterococcus gilvus]|uniref:hypothetical protein n=1 Tax=Enterococcus gilvus TaxID=160453 RepID=UPI00290FD1E6|nr:hypothetical protein [Enterococcus gilvus]MDU5509179.1 hypothetical protein [Enterococcus gilvus]